MNPCATWSGTYYSFTLDEPCACFLVYHLYLTCLYLPFAPENCIYEFPPVFRFSACALPCLAFASPHFTFHCMASQSHCLYQLRHTWRQSLTPRLHPQSHIWFTLRSPTPSILATSLAYHFGAHHEGVFQDWSPAFRQIHPFSSLPSPEPKPCTWHHTKSCISASLKHWPLVLQLTLES